MALEFRVIRSKKFCCDVEEYQSVYDFFVKSWVSTFEELNCEEVKFKKEFDRFSTIVAVFNDDKPVAFHAYSEFDLNLSSHREHSYFSQVEFPMAEALIQKGFFKVVTMEYMFVDPKFRKTAGFYLGEVLGGVSTQYLKDCNLDAVVTISRNDRGVNKMCEMYGGFPLVTELTMHKVRVDVMCFEPKSICSHPNPLIRKWIEQFKIENINTNSEGAAA